MSSEPKKQEQPAAENKPPKKLGSGRKALIVDDDPGTRELLKSILEKEDFIVLTAENGEIGFQRAQGESPNIIIADVLKPEKDGFSLFKELKENADTDYIPILIVTVRKNMEDSFMALGADAFVTKPIDREEFIKVIAGLPERKKSDKKTDEGAASEDKKDEKK